MPSPGASISAAMVTMDSAAMIVWLMPEHDGAPGHRQQHRPQPLPAGRAERGGRLHDGRGHAADAVRGEPDHRRERVDERGDGGRGRPDQEEQRQRREVDEGRQGLHEVEHRRERRREPGATSPAQTPSGIPRTRQTATADEGQREGVHALLPQPLQPEEGQPDQGQQGDPQVAERPATYVGQRDHAEPAELRDRPAAGRPGDQVLHRVDEPCRGTAGPR